MNLILSHYNGLATQPTLVSDSRHCITFIRCDVCNSAGPMTSDDGPCVQFREAVVKSSDTATGVRGLQMQC